MKLYSDLPGRRTAQIVADVALLCFVAVCVWVGRSVADGIGTLRRPADGLTSAGQSFRENMAGAAGQLDGIPLVGGGLRAPFDALTGTGQQIADVGTSLGSTVDTVARVAGVTVAVVPIVLALLGWALFRVTFVLRATAAAKLVRAPGAVELFALRALTRQPLRRLAPLGPDIAGRFRDGDPVLVQRLAALEMRSCGVSLDGGESSPSLARPA